MGCTRLLTLEDHLQAMQSMGKVASHQNEPLTKEQRSELSKRILANFNELNTTKRFLHLLDNPKSLAFQTVKALMEARFPSTMTEQDKEDLPHALRLVLKDHSDAMGLFEAATRERAPGQSAVQHHYEILSTAALKESVFTTANGKRFAIDPVDRVDFGMKMAAGNTQTRQHGTIEADALVHKKVDVFGLVEKTVGIDAKHSSSGEYSANRKELERQAEGIRVGFNDGKLDEFVFVTNGKFSKGFKEIVADYNTKIVQDFIEKTKLSIEETPREYLSAEEKKFQPETKISKSILKDMERTKELVTRYNIPQIDLCEFVTFKNLNKNNGL